ncbi:MAG TPA: glycosyltransferase family 9 protein [Candidatus Kapabacteria bacterium]|nr:glycosyltransferase family 9 protein [Candidatus Kapabacteria bacterium]
MKTLVIQPAFIGDAVISIALAEALKSIEPAAEIIYLVRPEAANLLRYAPAIAAVIPFDKYGADAGVKRIQRKAEELNTYHFDAVFCLHNSKRTLELLKRINCPIKVGGTSNSAFTHIADSTFGDDAVKRVVRFATCLYSNVDLEILPRLEIPDSLLPESLLKSRASAIGIAPGSVWGTKRWRAESFCQLIEQLVRNGEIVTLIGLDKDIDKALISSLNSMNYNLLNYISKLTLEETAAAISRLKLLISNDSASVHIAVATKTPVIDIFGPTVPSFGFAPRPENGLALEINDLWCRPCTTHGSNQCPVYTHDCMKRISVDMVLDSIKKYV